VLFITDVLFTNDLTALVAIQNYCNLVTAFFTVFKDEAAYDDLLNT